MIEDKGVELPSRANDEKVVNVTSERRRHNRLHVEHMEVSCEMPSASRVKVMNICRGGALVMADRVIRIGKTYALKIGYGGKTVFVKATAVWALLADNVQEADGEVIPLYIAGMQFVDVIKGEIREIISLLEADLEVPVYDAFMGSIQRNTYS